MENIINQRHGRFVILGKAYSNKRKQSYWFCLCDCGNIKVIRRDVLLRGCSKSCGCIQKEKGLRKCSVSGCNKKHHSGGYCSSHYMRVWRYEDVSHAVIERHGMSNASEYKVWQDMKMRCYCKSNDHYRRYGKRGIKICDEWKNNFVAFIEDMGLKPFPEAQIDRIDNDGDYEPKNCRWVTRIENRRNTSRNKLTIEKAREIRKIYKKGKISCVKLGKLYGVNGANIFNVIHHKIWAEIV